MKSLTKIRQSGNQKEIILDGKGVSPGIAIGRAVVFDNDLVNVPKYRIKPDGVLREQTRFKEAISRTNEQFLELKDKTSSLKDKENWDYIIEGYTQMLKSSRIVDGTNKRIASDLINAEQALQIEVANVIKIFEAMDDSYISAKVEDIRGVSRRLIQNLTLKGEKQFVNLPENSIVICNELSAADTVQIDSHNTHGFATLLGGIQGHASLFARSIGLPAAVDVKGLLENVHDGDIVVIDGTYGQIIVNPSTESLKKYRLYRANYLRWKRSFSRLKDLSAETLDGHKITLKGNIDLASEADFVMEVGADGVGLLRSEYMFLNRVDFPTEDEQFDIILKVVQSLKGKTLTFRTLDLGGDKPSDLIKSQQYNVENPALGLRGIRCSLKWQEILETQFAAILRASAYGPIEVMLPMVSAAQEITKARQIFNDVANKLRMRGIKIADNLPKLGIMIEVPGAAIESEALAEYAEFFSIGTNDLIQYTLATDRTNQNVSYIFNPMHPAVLRLIKMTVEAGNKKGIEVSICGEMAANYKYTAVLLGLGVKSLSMPASNIPMVKERIRSIRYEDTLHLVDRVMREHHPDEIWRIIREFESY